ncbi:hypothetical protein [Halalkalibacter urbisdiaboli]|uniref:hypothetical protein n=1 Tax=Halalkalibacter urbisdiaboli TaxID=1960589 RepID=UPI001FD8A13F|nr:hypothetical protein [Halalkalibacter urbisdiaboli]
MMNDIVYFRDNFFSAGQTEIFDEDQRLLGWLDLKSAFSSSVDILDENEVTIVKGFFPFFSNKWRVVDREEDELGIVRQRFSFFTKKFEYATANGNYMIESEAFSREYKVWDESGQLVVHFEKINGFFTSPAFRLMNNSKEISTNEWVAVVMGISAIQSRNQSATSSGGGAAQ